MLYTKSTRVMPSVTSCPRYTSTAGVSPKRPHRFTGRTTSYEPEAIELAAREAIVQLRHLSPGVNCRSFYYYPSHEGYGRPLQVASGDHETDPALLHLVRYLIVQEALYTQVTLNLVAAREELARLDPRKREVEPDAINPVVLFGRPIELQRSVPTADPNHAPISHEELRRILAISSNGTVATAPCNGHHRNPNLLDPPPSPSNREAVVPTNSASARPAHLDFRTFSEWTLIKTHGSLLQRKIYAYPGNGHRVPRGAASFHGTHSERDPVFIGLVQYVMAQESLTQHVMDFLQILTDQNPLIAIGEPLRIDPAGLFLRVLHPLTPEDEVDIPLPGIFTHER
ncbi:hypothetical protein D1007_43841 [Hordeum vulgare]|nr:hypothetical protein D1007_43841 [Hordeum vulgare]